MRSVSPSSPEQRQHINISQEAYDVIQNDSLTMMGKRNISGFINTILENCGETHFENKDLKAYSTLPKNVTLKIRLNKHNYADYYPTNGHWFGNRFKISQGEYIKAILEDYSRNTFFDREALFYKPIIDRISSQTDQGITPLVMNNGERYYVRPYRISEAHEAPYHYLIGLSSEDPQNTFKPASFRISRINTLKNPVTSYSRKELTQKERKNLESHVKEAGVAYLLGEILEIDIRLTRVGLEMYNSIFHQRPMYKTIQKYGEDYLLTFNSTELQIKNYFFTFANEAEIVSPNALKEWFKNRYKNALNSYI